MSWLLSRRNFLIQASAVLSASSLPGCSSTKLENDVLFGGSRYKDLSSNALNYSLVRITPASSEIKQAKTDFFPHGLAFINGQSKLAFAFQKIGAGAGLFDIDSMKLLEKVEPVKGRLFYGHGVCSQDNKLVYSTETAGSGDGAIGVRDASSLEYLGDFPTYGQHPHECHLIENGAVLAVTNGGGSRSSGQNACVCYIDVKSQKLLEKIEMVDERFNLGHMFALEGRQSILVSAPRRGLDDSYLGAISMQRNLTTMDLIQHPTEVVNKIFGEALSVLAIPSRDLFVVTHPTPGMLTIWQLSTGSFVKSLDLPHVRGVALASSHKGIWVSYGKQAELVLLSLDDFSLSQRLSNTYVTGSHLFQLPS